MRKLRVSFLHLAPVTCEIEHNRRLVERAVNVAADDGADWVITPELCIPGYLFMKQIGTDWITPQPGPWMEEFCKLVKKRNVSVFLSHPERDPATDKLYNTVFVINQQGHIVGKHSKIKALGGAESWSTAGTKIVPVECGGVQAGILICADAYKNEVAQALKDNGAARVIAYATHPVLSGPAIDNVINSQLDELVVTDTIPLSPAGQKCDKIRTLTMAPMLAEAVRRVCNEESISAMFR